MNGQSRKPLNEIFDDFVVSQTAKGLSEVTITTYHRHLRSISHHLDIQKPLDISNYLSYYWHLLSGCQ